MPSPVARSRCAVFTIASAWLLGGALMTASADDTRPFTVTPTLRPIHDKTLVVWARPANVSQRGGSALTLEIRDRFDAIVFGEIQPGSWMAGSDGFSRTQRDQSAYPVETEDAARGAVRVAIAYEGTRISIWRDDILVSAYTIEAAETFGDLATVLIGLRHLARKGSPDSYFAGDVLEARIYGGALPEDQVRALRMDGDPEPKPLARWTFEDGAARDVMGTFPDGVLYGGATISDGALHLDGVDDYMGTPASVSFPSPIHYRPAEGVLADPIPFYWKDEYHVFYLQGGVGPVPWQHIVSKDLVHWRELPTALRVDGAPDGPDGGHMFTGCVLEADGLFHIFYTGHNPANPKGLELVRHATSTDLITWQKDPDFTLGPDGVIYATEGRRNWRDPYVFWNDGEQCYFMVVIGTSASDGRDVQGLLTSKDLRSWTHQPPLDGAPGQECPDLFAIGNTWYLIGGGAYSYADSPRGPYYQPRHNVIDAPGVYAGKRMFDGKRHIWVGWAWESPKLDDRDDGRTWGGTMCLPRELYPGPDGELYCKPAEEVVRAFGRTVLDLADRPNPLPSQALSWRYSDDALELGAAAELSPVRFDVPGDALITCVAEMDPTAELAIALREQDDSGEAYRFSVRPGRSQIAIGTPLSEWVRDGCAIDESQPVKIQVFVIGTMIECFVNDAYAFTRRVYNHGGGQLGLRALGGRVRIRELTVRTP